MKTIIAFIKINMMNETKAALTEAGITSMTAVGGVYGRGKGLWEKKVIDAATEDVPEAIAHLGQEPRLRPQRMLTITVSDEKVKTVVDTIMEVNQTGEPGDGKIFVTPEYEVIRVRTGEAGDAILD